MAKYTGKSVTVSRPAGDLFHRLSDLSAYKGMIDNLPEEQRSRVSGIEFTADSVAFDAPGVGSLRFVVDELVEPSRVSFVAKESPIPLKLSVNLKPVAENETEVSPAIDIDIPAMLRPFIGPKIQEAADKFGEVFVNIVK